MTALSESEAAVVERFETSEPAPESAVEANLPATFPVDAFWVKVDKTPECWSWTGRTRDGYGVIMHKQKNYRAHRVSWMLTGRALPADLVIDHLCRNRACVNPSHMELVTNRENVLRGTGLSAQNARKTHCKRGHPLSGDNLTVAVGSQGVMRVCVICRREGWRKTSARLKPCPQCGAEMRSSNLPRHQRNHHQQGAVA